MLRTDFVQFSIIGLQLPPEQEHNWSQNMFGRFTRTNFEPLSDADYIRIVLALQLNGGVVDGQLHETAPKKTVDGKGPSVLNSCRTTEQRQHATREHSQMR